MIGIVKDNGRFSYLYEILDNAYIIDDKNFGYNIDTLIIPSLGIDSNYYILNTNINILKILENNNIKNLVTLKGNILLYELVKEYNIKLFELLSDNTFIRENANLTAKGVIDYLNNGNKDISNYSVFILGYGNIGFYLDKLLQAYNVEHKIYTKCEYELKMLGLLDKNYTDCFDYNYDIYINTIPSKLDLDYKMLKNKILLELASFPYGFDIDKIIALKEDVKILSKVPDRYAAYSAGLIIKDYLVRNNLVL